jgi:hypothetical protein
MANVDQMLAIASQKMSDQMCHAAGRPVQAGRTAMQNMSYAQQKQTRTDRLRR